MAERCRLCGRFLRKGVKRYCTLEHSMQAALDAQRQMHERRGPVYDEWKRKMAIGVQRIMPGIEAAERKARQRAV